MILFRLPGFGSSTPAPPAPPAEPPVAPSQASEPVKRAKREARQLAASARGDKSTLITGARGLTAPATTGKVSLLGQSGLV